MKGPLGQLIGHLVAQGLFLRCALTQLEETTFPLWSKTSQRTTDQGHHHTVLLLQLNFWVMEIFLSGVLLGISDLPLVTLE